jgi:hypothetical protein
MSRRPLNLAGMPNLDQLLAEAERQQLEVEKVNRTGEVRITAPWGKVLCNARRNGLSGAELLDRPSERATGRPVVR